MGFPEKNLKPPVEDINGNFQGGRVKVVGIPGVCQNLREKRGFLEGLMQKSGKFQGVSHKIDWKSRGQLQKKSLKL